MSDWKSEISGCVKEAVVEVATVALVGGACVVFIHGLSTIIDSSAMLSSIVDNIKF